MFRFSPGENLLALIRNSAVAAPELNGLLSRNGFAHKLKRVVIPTPYACGQYRLVTRRIARHEPAGDDNHRGLFDVDEAGYAPPLDRNPALINQRDGRQSMGPQTPPARNRARPQHETKDSARSAHCNCSPTGSTGRLNTFLLRVSLRYATRNSWNQICRPLIAEEESDGTAGVNQCQASP
jgi:hypothetical protein